MSSEGGPRPTLRSTPQRNTDQVSIVAVGRECPPNIVWPQRIEQPQGLDSKQWFGAARPFKALFADPRQSAGYGRAAGCRVRHCVPSTIRSALPPAQCLTGLPRRAPQYSALPATRQAAGVPSAWSQPFQSTHARPRRWRDAGPLGRPSVTADQKAGT